MKGRDVRMCLTGRTVIPIPGEYKGPIGRKLVVYVPGYLGCKSNTTKRRCPIGAALFGSVETALLTTRSQEEPGIANSARLNWAA